VYIGIDTLLLQQQQPSSLMLPPPPSTTSRGVIGAVSSISWHRSDRTR
jgi:hypothetical protein